MTSAASYGRIITRVNLTIDRATGAVARASAVNEIVTRDVPKDPIQTAIIARYGALSAPIANRIAGSITGRDQPSGRIAPANRRSAMSSPTRSWPRRGPPAAAPTWRS